MSNQKVNHNYKPPASVKRKSADKMFEDLGYRKINDDDRSVVFERIDDSFFDEHIVDRIYIKFQGGRYYRNALIDRTRNNYCGHVELDSDEIFACANFLEEMRKDETNDA